MNRLTPVKAIRRYCLGRCSSGSPKQVRFCDDLNCPLKEFRLGKNPNRKGIGGKKPVFSSKEIS